MKRARPVAPETGWWRWAAVLWMSAAAATAGVGPATDSGAWSSVLDPLAVSPEMRDWVERVLGDEGSASVPQALLKLRRLHEALTEAGAAGIAEIAEPTPTAEEAFTSRRADCLGFALLFVALARERGIGAGFALVAEVASIDRRAGLWVQRGHFTALYEGRVFDLGGERALDPARDAPVTDRAAVALFLSNRGAQSLVAGEAGAAVELFYRAVRSDPSVPWVWSNLGVALSRAGDLEGAILAQEMALRLAPGDATAQRNLAAARRHAVHR